MRVRSRLAMVIHLGRCSGCNACAVACKRLHADRRGAEHIWLGHVETKPGTGYPTRWEDQDVYQGGWLCHGGEVRLRAARGLGRRTLALLFDPGLPTIDDYYEPFGLDGDALVAAPEGDDLPTAMAVSRLTGLPTSIASGPRWDADLAGSGRHAAADPNLDRLAPDAREALLAPARLGFFPLPRLCNHCAHPACVAACPSGAMHQRAGDGIVRVDRRRCRGARRCVASCPYKKSYVDYLTGQGDKCELCADRLARAEPPACVSACPSRSRQLGPVLYDASGLSEAVARPTGELCAAQRDLLLDPTDPDVAAAAAASGISEQVLAAAIESPLFGLVGRHALALPLHAEHRTLPMVFYVPPLLPLAARSAGEPDSPGRPFGAVAERRLSLAFLAELFGAGNEQPVRASLARQLCARVVRRAQATGTPDRDALGTLLAETGISLADAEEIRRLLSPAPSGLPGPSPTALEVTAC